MPVSALSSCDGWLNSSERNASLYQPPTIANQHHHYTNKCFLPWFILGLPHAKTGSAQVSRNPYEIAHLLELHYPYWYLKIVKHLTLKKKLFQKDLQQFQQSKKSAKICAHVQLRMLPSRALTLFTGQQKWHSAFKNLLLNSCLMQQPLIHCVSKKFPTLIVCNFVKS